MEKKKKKKKKKKAQNNAILPIPTKSVIFESECFSAPLIKLEPFCF